MMFGVLTCRGMVEMQKRVMRRKVGVTGGGGGNDENERYAIWMFP